jgi:DNA-nicking Smr family endonuclease
MKLKLDLHDVYNRGQDIDRALQGIIDEAVAKKAPVVEIIPGKGSGQLKKHVLRFLERKDIKAKYHRIEKTRRTSAACSCTSAGRPYWPVREPDACVGQRGVKIGS